MTEFMGMTNYLDDRKLWMISENWAGVPGPGGLEKLL
jgi:hypothetical protein